MATLLGLTTSSARGGVSVVCDGSVLSLVTHEDERRHAEMLMTLVDDALREAAVDKSDLDALACDVGPGSFTGVRVGVATAKGIALGLGLPLVPVGSLEAMARAAFALADVGVGTVAALLDARRGEVFMEVHAKGGRVLVPACHTPTGEMFASLGPRAEAPDLRFCGRMAELLGVPRERRIDASACDLPDASWVARIALERLSDGEAGDMAAIEPLYLRPPDATPQRLKRTPLV